MNVDSHRFVSLGLCTFASLAAAVGCGSSDPTAAPLGCDTIDFSTYDTASLPSFETDIMPIFGFSCAASACHNSRDKTAGLDLGVRCQPSGSGATVRCVFPDAVDPNDTSGNPPQPLTRAILDATYASLLSPATTVTSPVVERVVKGDPENSFIIQKTSGKQAQPGYACTNQDPTHTAHPLPCGDSMPLNSPALCAGSGRRRFDLLAAWIAGGAPKN